MLLSKASASCHQPDADVWTCSAIFRQRRHTWGALGGRQDQMLLPRRGVALDEGPEISATQSDVEDGVHSILSLKDKPVGMVPLKHELGCQQIHLQQDSLVKITRSPDRPAWQSQDDVKMRRHHWRLRTCRPLLQWPPLSRPLILLFPTSHVFQRIGALKPPSDLPSSC